VSTELNNYICGNECVVLYISDLKMRLFLMNVSALTWSLGLCNGVCNESPYNIYDAIMTA
jgi:hypothetical protein